MKDDSKVVRWLPVFLGVATFLFYLWTLAPTVLWGDDAYFQTAAFLGELPGDGSYHWLWLQLARLFAQFPVGDVAYRVNLLSAVGATVTVVLLYLAARLLGLRWDGALVTAVSLAVAHTFWMHAIRAEVYTLFTAVYVLQCWLWFRWQENEIRPLLLAAILLGFLLLSHQMGVLMLPAFLALIYWRRRWLSKQQWGYLLIALLLGAALFLLILSLTIGRLAQTAMGATLLLYFTHSGSDFSGVILDFSWASLPRDVAFLFGFWGLQFVGLAGILGIVGVFAVWRGGWSVLWRVILLLYGTAVFFAFSYHVNDQYVFYLPSFVAFTFFIGAGWDWVAQRFMGTRWRGWATAGALVLLVVGPVFVYWLTPQLLIKADVNPLGIRELPGREPNAFFLWPGKNGYDGALNYGQELLQSLPAGAVVIADHTPAETLRYLQVVEGVRPDVVVIRFEPAGKDLAPLLAQFPSDTAVFLADNNPEYYNLSQLPEATLTPAGFAYRLQLP